MYKLLISATAFISLFAMFSCSSSKVTDSNSSSKISDSTPSTKVETTTPISSIPEGFRNPDMIMLVEKKTKGIGRNGWNTEFEDNFKKYYTGKYEMITLEQITADSKYKDKKTYPYIVHQTIAQVGVQTTRYSKKGIKYDHSYSTNYYLYDRSTDTQVDLEVTTGSLARPMKEVAKKLNKYFIAK